MTLIPSFHTVLPRLVASYEAGRLVPFIGSGMSRLTCTDWMSFVRNLESAVDPDNESTISSETSRDELVRRANVAVRSLKGRESGAFAAAVRAALVSHRPVATSAFGQQGDVSWPDVPSQTRALARIRWPLALTTNYDNCYVKAVLDERRKNKEAHVEMSVVGRGAEDCQRVLNSLSVAGRPLLWALQGHLADLPCGPVSSEVAPALDTQLVVGHEEYRRVTYRELHFRRAFAEVFRQRSLLFLGAGLQESYLQELFGEVLETFGPATRPHYAFIQEGEVDPGFMLARFQIICIEYPKGKHDEIEHRLCTLADEVSRPKPAPLSWQWGRIESSSDGHWTSVPDFEVVRGPLPNKAAPGECLAVSAGGSGERFFFSEGIRQVLKGWRVPAYKMPDKLTLPYLGQYAGLPVFAVRARDETDARSLAHIAHAARALFDHVARSYRCIRLQLLATGGRDKATLADVWKVRNYPERFSFVQIACAWGAWRREHPDVPCRLALHVVLESVLQDVASGRIDVLELLSCRDMRFFVEVSSDTPALERRLFQTIPELKVREVVGDLQLDPSQWMLRVTPPADLEVTWLTLDRTTLDRSLESIGVLPGSTIHFRRAATA